jgi:hypothetical protein
MDPIIPKHNQDSLNEYRTMYNITLLSSFHKILGKCNPDELYKIIWGIQPEIIFEELSFDTFCFVYSEDYIPNTVEAITIKNYIRNCPIKHFPVDTYPINESDLFNGADEIAQRSNEYVKLLTEQVSMITNYGYNFLNSDACIELLEKIRIAEETGLLVINDEKLFRDFKSENELHNKRENEMISNIFNYSKQYPYNKALLICGVEHRKPLGQIIQKYETKEKLKLNWTFYKNQNFYHS